MRISTYSIKNLLILVIASLLLSGCDEEITRSGVVIDSQTGKPVEGVSIDVYLKYQKRDSLLNKVLTDQNGKFFISEKKSEGLLFLLDKEGYTGFVSSLSKANDTIRLEPSED